MAKIKLTKNELKVQKDALKMYRRYLPTLTLKKQQLQSEIRTIEAKAKAVRKEREDLEFGFREWIAVFSETDAFPKGIITVSNIRKGKGNIAGVDIPIIVSGASSLRRPFRSSGILPTQLHLCSLASTEFSLQHFWVLHSV